MRSLAAIIALVAVLVPAIGACGTDGAGSSDADGPTTDTVARVDQPSAEAGGSMAATDDDSPSERQAAPTAVSRESSRAAASQSQAPPGGELVCEAAEGDALWVACNVRDAIRSRNLSALPSFMSPQFHIGPWRSEWTTAAPDQVIEELARSRLPDDPSVPLTFTVDRAAFPELAGAAPEALLGPDADVALVAYSHGWEFDGAGEALLFFSKADDGTFRWSGLLIAPVGFDD